MKCRWYVIKCRWNHGETFTAKIYKLGPKCRWNILIVGENHTCIHVHVTALHVFFCFLLLSFVFCIISYFIFQFDTGFFRDASMAYILFMRLSTHLVLRILSNPRIYIVVLLYKSLSNPNISIGLYRLFFSLSRVDNQLCFINIRMCLFLCSAHIELGH